MSIEKSDSVVVSASDASSIYIRTAVPNQFEQQVISKIARRLIWFLFVLFVFSFLDRINIGFAGLTMSKSLGLTATMFGLATTIFYVVYVIFGVPSNLIFSRIGARRWMATIMVAWGIASTCTMFARDATTLYILRALVGITEAGFLPGMLLYLTYWFPSAYRARANALFMIAMPVTTALGSVVSGYLLGMDGKLGLAGWQWLFCLEGLPAVLLGIVVWFYLDDSPAKAKWLSAEEKSCLQEMLEAERHKPQAAPKQQRSTVHEIFSPTVIKFALGYFCLVNADVMVGIWVPQVVKSFNADSSNVAIGLMAAFPQVCTVLGMIWLGRRSDRKQERKWHMILPMLFSAAGWLIAAYAGDSMIRLLGLAMASTGSFAATSIFWTTPDSVLSNKAKAVGLAAINAFGNFGAAVNSLVVGVLKDLTHSFSAGLLFAAIVLLVGVVVLNSLPIKSRSLTSPS
ncbi:4-hydroxyphenylacetate permease [Crenobacter sp. SG2305]|uniref:4-hydroxyphenylacetate permease n=1 Tax=Crenobacter oryzisoli TaxID=3056844 RepID=UPI0025AAFB95|nr:4-hydroxyphenylacetate permease [Crenobacter sp. SG2305]MDN0083887.1 4-hydroxyphenylacetate permease [Crenobacter sp. SG2305]